MEHKQRGGKRGEMDAAVDIAGNVDNQIDVNSDSSDNELLLDEVVRAPDGRALLDGTYADCSVGAI